MESKSNRHWIHRWGSSVGTPVAKLEEERDKKRGKIQVWCQNCVHSGMWAKQAEVRLKVGSRHKNAKVFKNFSKTEKIVALRILGWSQPYVDIFFGLENACGSSTRLPTSSERKSKFLPLTIWINPSIQGRRHSAKQCKQSLGVGIYPLNSVDGGWHDSIFKLRPFSNPKARLELLFKST